MTSLFRLGRAFMPALLALLLLPAATLGHAELVESDPPAGGTLEATPYTLSATFSEPLDPGRSRVVVRDAGGSEVARGGVAGDDDQLMAVELPELAPGDYVARWTAVGTDGHVERGNIEFNVQRSPATPAPAATPTAEPAATPAPAAANASPTTATTPDPTPVLTTPPPGPVVTRGGQPAVVTTDLLIALIVAAVLIGVLFFVLWRRRPA